MQPGSLIIAFALLAACGKGSEVPAALRADIANICEAESRSGALLEDENRRAVVVAQWLGSVIQTQDARDFLGRMATLDGANKGAALRKEARRVGLGACPLADTWK